MASGSRDKVPIVGRKLADKMKVGPCSRPWWTQELAALGSPPYRSELNCETWQGLAEPKWTWWNKDRRSVSVPETGVVILYLDCRLPICDLRFSAAVWRAQSHRAPCLKAHGHLEEVMGGENDGFANRKEQWTFSSSGQGIRLWATSPLKSPEPDMERDL